MFLKIQINCTQPRYMPLLTVIQLTKQAVYILTWVTVLHQNGSPTQHGIVTTDGFAPTTSRYNADIVIKQNYKQKL